VYVWCLLQELLSLPKADANSRAAALIKRWNFPNTYTLGKHMSEQLVARYQAKQQLPVAIVRPSLVSAIAGKLHQYTCLLTHVCAVLPCFIRAVSETR
jgi:thioester reductase-like protein